MTKHVSGFALARKSKAALPRIPFEQIKREVLGSSYDLSFVWAPPSLTRKLNRMYRKNDRPANVLSFPLSSNSGELFIAPTVAKKDAPNFNLPYEDFITLLFIHGLLHLKGLSHGSTMDTRERKLLSRFCSRDTHTRDTARTRYGKTHPRNRH